MLQAKKLLSVALGLALVAAQANAAPKDGVYKEKVMGLIAPFTVEVTLEGGKIVKVTSNDALESPGVGAEAIKTLGDRIVREQTAGVDGGREPHELRGAPGHASGPQEGRCGRFLLQARP